MRHSFDSEILTAIDQPYVHIFISKKFKKESFVPPALGIEPISSILVKKVVDKQEG